MSYDIQETTLFPAMADLSSGQDHRAASGYGCAMESEGDGSTSATSGNAGASFASGYYCRSAAAGNNSIAEATGNCAAAASAGNSCVSEAMGAYSKSAASGNGSMASASGRESIAMVAGLYGKARAGKNGAIALAWRDGRQIRVAVGIVGERGIRPDVWYRVSNQGQLVEVNDEAVDVVYVPDTAPAAEC